MCYRCCSISIGARKALLVLGPNKKFGVKVKVFSLFLDGLCLVQIIPTVFSRPSGLSCLATPVFACFQ